MKVATETIERIASMVPTSNEATSLDIWRASAGISHQTVKNGLKALVDCGRILRTEQRFNPGGKALGTRVHFVYRRVEV